MVHPSESRQSKSPVRSAVAGWSLAIGFAALAIGLLNTSRLASIPLKPTVVFNPAALVPGPRRVAMTDPAHLMVEGMSENCNACHQIFRSSHPAGATLNYHQDVRLNHGLNNRCVNCHDADNRERLTLRDGATVVFSETPQLCSQCHGTVYRDWQRGTHGKTMGSWVTGSKEQLRLNCNQCHDPHSPRYPAYQPLPGPDTLRMGDQQSHGADEPSRSPLQRWLKQVGTDRETKPTLQGRQP